MIRPLHFSGLLIALIAGISCLHAQDASPSPASTPEDIRAMRQMIEQQTLKIEALSQQVTKLNQQLESAHGVAPAPAPISTPAVVHTETAVKAEVKPAAEPPRAEPVGTPGTTHMVARGETLTSIAKHYKTSVADLLKANKIEDDRKLQIGQLLIIPPTKDAEPATTKKEIE
ncbi:MAG: LysM peptidoglycan-binding domain-containing protein [Verrucomicrobiota bacterium]